MVTAKGKQTKATICNAAVELINMRGYNNVTVAAICEYAGVSNGSFFYFFRAKDDVLVEYVRSESDELESFFAELDKTDAVDTFRQVIKWQAHYYARKGEDVVGHLHSHLILSKRKFVLEYALGKVLGQCIELGRDQGVFKSGPDALQLGNMFMNDIISVTSFIPWPSGNTGGIAQQIIDRSELYLNLLRV